MERKDGRRRGMFIVEILRIRNSIVILRANLLYNKVILLVEEQGFIQSYRFIYLLLSSLTLGKSPFR